METQDYFAPYAPTENVLRVLNKARGGGVRGPIDTPFLIQLGINDSMAPRAIRTLSFLGFIENDGAATPLLEEYVRADDEEAKRVLRQAVETAYALIFRAVNPETDTRQKIFNAFRTMKPQGQWDRMVTLFLGLCREAGYDVKDAPPTRSGKLDSPRETRVSRIRERFRSPARRTTEGAGDRAWPNDAPGVGTSLSRETLDPSLVAFLGKLRDIDSLDSLDTWYQAFKGLFSYVLATKPKPTPPQETNEDQSDV
jgi:hypothetical protein